MLENENLNVWVGWIPGRSHVRAGDCSWVEGSVAAGEMGRKELTPGTWQRFHL